MTHGSIGFNESTTPDKYYSTVEIDRNGRKEQVSKAVIVDEDGNELPVAKDGTDATDVAPLAGGVGIRGWLSSIFKVLSDRLPSLSNGKMPVTLGDDAIPVGIDGRAADDTEPQAGAVGTIGWLSSIFVMVKRITAQLPTSLGAKTSENSLSVTPATDAQFIVKSNDKAGFMSAFTIVPTTTLAVGTTYLSIYNGGSTPVKFRDFRIRQQFRGTAAATSSEFEIVPYTHTADSTAGTLVPSHILSLTNPAVDAVSGLSIRASNVGGIISGGVQSAKKLIFGSNNQLGMDYEFSLNENLFPVTIQPGTGLLLKANSIIVVGTILRVQMLWEE